MPGSPSVLGIFLSGHDLFYSVRDKGDPYLRDAGTLHFNFHLEQALRAREDGLEGVAESLRTLCERTGAATLHVHSDAADEIWAVGQSAFLRTDGDPITRYRERLQVLGHPDSPDNLLVTEVPRGTQEPPVLVMKRKSLLERYAPILPYEVDVRFVSELESGAHAAATMRELPSLLLVHASDRHMGFSLFGHGRLRQAARIEASTVGDLDYWYHHHSTLLPWLTWEHESILFYGSDAYARAQEFGRLSDRFHYAFVAEEPADAGIVFHPGAEREVAGYPVDRGLPALLACAMMDAE